jgi:hypothetical protein
MAGTALAALALAGCGGGDDGDSNKEAGYGDFTADVNKICADAEPKGEALTKQLTGKADADAPVWGEFVTLLEDSTADLEALDAPEELQSDFDTFKATGQETLTLAEEAKAAAESGDDAEYQQAVKNLEKGPASENDAAASKLGADECISDDDSN